MANKQKNSYADNLYNKWVREGRFKEYACSGIYAIKDAQGHILYIGKSNNIRRRMAEHRVDINCPAGKEHKYSVINEIERRLGKKCFVSILEEVQGEEKLGYAEGWHIRRNCPPLNTEIPREDNWRKWDINQEALTISADEVLRDFEIYDEYRKMAQRKSA